MRILVVEDEEVMAEALVEVLEEECYAVDLARHGARAAELMEENEYRLVILDWSIPGPSGIELLRRWRGEGHETPVLMLTGRRGLDDRVGGLDSGADDYLTKPFSFAELLARVRSLARRGERSLRPLEAGPLEMDRATRTVTVGGRPVELTPREFALLEHFLLHRGEVVTRSDLLEQIWDAAFDPMSNVIDVTIHRLRKKIGTDGPLLHTVPGVGYVLRPPQGEEA